MSYARGFYMITERDGLTPVIVRVKGIPIIPTFNDYRAASRFLEENIRGDYRVTEVAVGRA